MIFLVCLLCLLNQAFGQVELAAEDAVDDLIKVMHEKIVFGEIDVIHADELKIHTRLKHFPGTISCRGGTIKSLGSIRKSDAVNVTRENNRVIINIPLELGKLQYHYRYCKYIFFHYIHSHGSLTATAESNTLQVLATVTKEDESCEAIVSSIKFVNIGKVKIELTGRLGSKLKSRAKGQLVQHMRSYVPRKIIEKFDIVTPLVFTNETLCNDFDQFY